MAIDTGEAGSATSESPGSVSAVVAAAQGGDRQALETLLRDHYDRVYAVCHRLVGNDADAADAAQEAMISVVRGLPAFDNRSSFSTWAYRIAYNSSLDLLRRRARRPFSPLEDAGDRRVSAAGADSVDEKLDVGSALMKVPVEFRAPVVLRDLCGLDYAEIADLLRLPAGTVRSRISRGRAMLVKLIKPARSES